MRVCTEAKAIFKGRGSESEIACDNGGRRARSCQSYS